MATERMFSCQLFATNASLHAGVFALLLSLPMSVRVRFAFNASNRTL
jgi:hypothetical protein